MSRALGTFNFSANFEVKVKGMLDARMFCPTYADLLTFTSDNYLMNGFPVAVWDTDPEKVGIYQLINENALSNPESWKKVSGGGGEGDVTMEDLTALLALKADLVNGKVPASQLPALGITRQYADIATRDADANLAGVSFGLVLDASADNDLPVGQRTNVMYANTTTGWRVFNVEGYEGIYNSNQLKADLTVGGWNVNETLPAGSTWEDAFVKLLSKTFNPTFVNPSFGMVHSAGSLREINESIDLGLTLSFNPGAILGVMANNEWNPAGHQNNRAGAASNYRFIRANNTVYTNQGVNQYIVDDYVVTAGTNMFKGEVTYAAGAQPKDSKNANYLAPLPSGTSPQQTTTFEGVYPFFGTTVDIVNAAKQALVTLMNTGSIIIPLVAEFGGNKQKFWVPDLLLSGYNKVLKVEYFNTVSNQFDPNNKITDFLVSNANQTVQGVSVPYKLYTHNTADRGALAIRISY